MKLFKKIIHADAIWVLTDQALYSGTNFILTLFLAKQMHIADFGIFSTVIIITYLALSFMNAILIQPFQVSVATVSNKKEYYVFLFLGLVILLVLFMFLAWIPAFFIEAKAFHFFDVAFFIAAIAPI